MFGIFNDVIKTATRSEDPRKAPTRRVTPLDATSANAPKSLMRRLGEMRLSIYG